MGYVSATRGFQSGGWNLQTPQNPAFGPETINDFEAGLKYSSRSQRLSANANIFYSRYSDLQVTAVTPIGSVTTNATSAKISGVELQFAVQPDARSDVTLGMQLLTAKFGQFPNAACVDFNPNATAPYAPISCDATGNRLPFAPKLKFNLGGVRHLSLRRSGSLVLTANLAYNSGYFSEPDNVVRQDEFGTVDLSAEWQPNWRGPSIQLWALNLTDAQYFNGLTTVATAGALQIPAAPRRFGATLRYVF
jgi:outer membrane receptor protein involved in Fe transport